MLRADATNVAELMEMTFVFLAIDHPPIHHPRGRSGSVRTTIVTLEKSDHVDTRISTLEAVGPDAYRTNIQIAELSAATPPMPSSRGSAIAVSTQTWATSNTASTASPPITPSTATARASPTSEKPVAISRLEHQFVDQVPVDIESGILFVSMSFRTTMHRCA